MNLAFAQLEGDIVVGNERSELFANIEHFNYIFQESPPLTLSKGRPHGSPLTQ